MKPPDKPPPRKRRIERCPGCGGLSDGRHLDRELLKDAKTDDEVPRETKEDGCL